MIRMPRASNGASTSIPKAESRFSFLKMSRPFSTYCGSTRFLRPIALAVPS
jgi:hypothetical protein